MKFIIELEDFWVDSEDDGGMLLHKELKAAIISETVATIKKEIKEMVATQIELKVREALIEQLNSTIEQALDEFVKSGVIKGRYRSDPPISYKEYLENGINDATVIAKLDEKLKKVMNDKVDVLMQSFRERYDTAFATQIVRKLNDNKMLKDDVASLLLQQP